MVEADIKAESTLEHWSQYLRCTICFSYLRDPHTLECGHTFCKSCLKRLAQIAKEDTPDIRVTKLGLPCPTCRHPFPAKPYLTGRASTSIVLRHMIDLWAKESKLLKVTSAVQYRSLPSQTDEENSKSNDGDENKRSVENEISDIVFSERYGPLEHNTEFMFKKILEYADDFDPDSNLYYKRDCNDIRNVTTALNDSISSGSDTDASNSSHGVDSARSFSNVTLSDVFNHLSIPAISISAFSSPGRFLIMFIWCTYCVVIVGLAQSFLPYIILFTLFFFLLVMG